MPTHNHTRKPATRESVAVSCNTCGLTAQQVQILGEPVCCGSPFTHPLIEAVVQSSKVATSKRALTLFPQSETFKPQVASLAEYLPAPVPPYQTIIIADCDYCGGDGRNHDLDDDYEPCEHCNSGKVFVLRNWLGEAFQIENGMLTIEPRREHLTALKHYATQVVNVYNTDHSREVA
jgi:hypothetical protein